MNEPRILPDQTVLIADGRIVGAVGVSGVTGDQDEQCAGHHAELARVLGDRHRQDGAGLVAEIAGAIDERVLQAPGER